MAEQPMMYRVEAVLLTHGQLAAEVFRGSLRDWMENASGGGEVIALVVQEVNEEQTRLYLEQRAEIERELDEMDEKYPCRHEGVPKGQRDRLLGGFWLKENREEVR